jgi:hypothetical protein
MKNIKDLKKEAFDITVSGYPDYEYISKDLIATMLESTPILSGINWTTGYKADTTVNLNILDESVSWYNDSCAATASGSSVIAPRSVEVKRLFDRDEICLDKLDSKLPILQKAGANNTEMTFASAYIDHRINVNARELEIALFQGDTVSGSGNNAKVDGLLAVAAGETGDLALYGTFSSFTAGNAISTVTTMLAGRSQVMYELEDVTLYMSLPYFSILRQAWLTANPSLAAGTGVYLNGAYADQIDKNAMYWPGENVIIRGTHALKTNNSMIMLPFSSIRGVTDLESDKESVEMFFDKKSRKFYADIVFAAGFTYTEAANVVYFKKV